jgi:hypothetical protein
MTRLSYYCPKGREVPGWQELDLKSHGKLRDDLLEDLLYRTRTLDQDINRT